MAKQNWNSFVEEYPRVLSFVAGVSGSLPKQLQFGEKNKKLSTPYGLFQEWLARTLKGE
jgi:hypothetical protein